MLLMLSLDLLTVSATMARWKRIIFAKDFHLPSAGCAKMIAEPGSYMVHNPASQRTIYCTPHIVIHTHRLCETFRQWQAEAGHEVVWRYSATLKIPPIPCFLSDFVGKFDKSTVQMLCLPFRLCFCVKMSYKIPSFTSLFHVMIILDHIQHVVVGCSEKGVPGQVWRWWVAPGLSRSLPW